jgi:hypothetical protein
LDTGLHGGATRARLLMLTGNVVCVEHRRMRDRRVPLGWRIAGAIELLLAVVTLIVSVSGTETRAIPGCRAQKLRFAV